MNINNVYEVEIRIVLDSNHYNDEYNSKFIKKTIVYKGEYNDYYDLSTNQRYVVGARLCTRGDMFIDPETMVPIKDLIEIKKTNMLKCRILKKYQEKSGPVLTKKLIPPKNVK